MFEFLCMSLLGVAYVKARFEEKKEEEIRKLKEKENELKIKVFCYSVRHNMLYNDVVKLINDHKLSFKEIDNDSKEYAEKQ